MVHHFEYTVDYHSDTDSHSDQALEQHNADSIIYAPTPLPDANMFFPDSPALEHNVASASWSAGPYPAQFESIGGATTTHNATPPTDTTTSKPTATSAEPAEQATHSRPRIRSNDLGKYNFNIVDLIIAYNKNPAQTLDQFITTKYPELGAAFLKSQSEDVSSTFAAHAMEVDDDDNDYDDYDENRWENYATGMRDDSDLVPAFHHTLPVTHMDWIERAVDLVYAEPVLLTPNMHQQRNGLVVVGVRCSGNGPGSLNHVRNALETHLDTANPVHADLTPWEKGCLGHTVSAMLWRVMLTSVCRPFHGPQIHHARGDDYYGQPDQDLEPQRR